MLQLFGFRELIRTQTRITADMESLIHIIASNNCASIKDITVVPWNISDNQLIECVRKLNQMKFPKKTITRKYYISYDPAKVSDHLSEVDWNSIYNFHDFNLALNIFMDMSSTVFNSFD